MSIIVLVFAVKIHKSCKAARKLGRGHGRTATTKLPEAIGITKTIFSNCHGSLGIALIAVGSHFASVSFE